MSNTKFTPGPWRLETVKTSCGICHKIGPFPGSLRRENNACVYVDYNNAANELLANAHLIGAAPELYEALVTLDQFASAGSDYHGSRLRDIVHAALAKASGESEA